MFKSSIIRRLRGCPPPFGSTPFRYCEIGFRANRIVGKTVLIGAPGYKYSHTVLFNRDYTLPSQRFLTWFLWLDVRCARNFRVACHPTLCRLCRLTALKFPKYSTRTSMCCVRIPRSQKQLHGEMS